MTGDDHKQLKASMRALVKQSLAQMTDRQLREASINACQRLMSLPAIDDAQVVMAYMPLPEEVDVTFAIKQLLELGKRVCVPDVNWSQRSMTPIQLTSLNDRAMDQKRYGLRVPSNAPAIDPQQIDVVIVPGLAFDANGHRLGRGGGFYDRFLATLHGGVAKVAVAFEAQIIETPPGVPMSVTDISVDMVVTEQRVMHRPAHRSPNESE